jgi:hypothetical protein
MDIMRNESLNYSENEDKEEPLTKFNQVECSFDKLDIDGEEEA